MLTQAFCSFLTLPISNIPYAYDDGNIGFYFCNQNTGNSSESVPVDCNQIFNPILCNDQYGGGGPMQTALNPSYFDPVCLYDIYLAAVDLGFNSAYAYAYTN
jgi:hypothetical protein